MSEPSYLQELRETAFMADPSALLATLDHQAAGLGDEAIFKEILGIAKIRSGDTTAGIAALLQAMDSPDHTLDIRSMLVLMRAYYGAKELDAAFEIAQRILEIDAEREPALRVAARIATLRGEDDRAESLWRQICSLSGEKLEAALNVARIAQRRGRWETQSQFADVAVAAEPQNPDALRLAVQARMRTRRFEDFPRLIPMLFRFEPAKALAHLRGATGLDQASMVAATMSALRGAGLMDDALAAQASELARTWLIAGRRAIGAKNESVAALLFQAALQADPAARPALEELIKMSRPDLIAMRAAYKAGDFAAAGAHAQKVLDVNPAQYEAWSTLGRLYLDSEPLRAIPSFEKCISLQPEDPWPKLNLAKAFERTDRLPAALALYEALAGLTQPEVRHYHDEAAKAAANLRRLILRRARDAFRERRLLEAWALGDALRSGEMSHVDIAGLMDSIGRALVVSLRRKHAQHDPDFIEEAERYLELAPGEREVLVPLARAYMAKRSFDRALVIWRQLAAVDAAAPNVQVQIARCARALGLRDVATAAAEEALRLDPSLEIALSIQKQLNPKVEVITILS